MDENGIGYALGRSVRAQRRRLGLTQEELGEKADVHWTFIGHIERGRKLPSLRVLTNIAGALGTTPAQLLCGVAARAPRAESWKRP
ncbi:MAG: helix-turn-helix transcriptional regulator [Elusimicrobiota bacterium]